MSRLEILLLELIELLKVAKAEKQDMLAYLLEMAVVEAQDRVNMQRRKA